MTLLPEESLRSLLAVDGLFHDVSSLQKLFFYFQYEGLGSIVLWMLALVLLLAYAIRWRKSLVCWTALAMAVGGFVLAKVNSHNVSAIKIDFSAQVEAAKARAEEEAADSRSMPAGESPSEGRPESLSDAEEGRLGNLPYDPAYRRDGAVQRTEGKQVEEKIPIDAGAADEPAVARMMSTEEVAQANRLDRSNRFFARWTLCLAVGLAVIDYCRRFNTTFGCYLPLPFSGRLVDSLFPKSHTVCVGRRRRSWKKYLRRVARKGETFVFFSEKDPWSGKKGTGAFCAKHPKGRSGKMRLSPFSQPLRRLPWYLPLPWRLEKVVCNTGDRQFDDEFLFESAWFARYGFVVLGDEKHAVDLLDSMAGFLELRRATRASARRTVNIVWDLQTDIPDATLDRLLRLCPETNFRLIVVLATPPDATLAGRIQEVRV